MPATPVTIKFTKKQLELIDEVRERAGFKSQSAAIKAFMWHGLNALIEQWRDQDMEAALQQWHEGELAHGGDRKSKRFEQSQ